MKRLTTIACASILLAAPAFAQERQPTPPADAPDRIPVLIDDDMRFDIPDVDFEFKIDDAEFKLDSMIGNARVLVRTFGDRQMTAEQRAQFEKLVARQVELAKDLEQKQSELAKARRDGASNVAELERAVADARAQMAEASGSLAKLHGANVSVDIDRLRVNTEALQLRAEEMAKRFQAMGGNVRIVTTDSTLPGGERVHTIIMRSDSSATNIDCNARIMVRKGKEARVWNRQGEASNGQATGIYRFKSEGGENVIATAQGDSIIINTVDGEQMMRIFKKGGEEVNVIVSNGDAAARIVPFDSLNVNGEHFRRMVVIEHDTTADARQVIIIRRGTKNKRKHQEETSIKPAPTPSEQSTLQKGALGTSDAGYALQEATPNPFDQSTSLSFTLPSSGHTTLAVFDEAGNLVKTLVDQEMTAGSHTVNFDGSSLPSGLYLYRLVSGNYSQTKTMRLVK